MRLVCVSAHNRLWLHALNLCKNAIIIINGKDAYATSATNEGYAPICVEKKKLPVLVLACLQERPADSVTATAENAFTLFRFFLVFFPYFSCGRRLFIGFTQETPNVIYFVAHNALLILVRNMKTN